MTKRIITMQEETKGMTLEKAMENFIQYNEYKNNAERTIQNYKEAYSILCDVFNPNDDCSLITIDTVYSFAKKKKEQNPEITDVSIQSYIRQLRVILYYFMKNGYTTRFQVVLPSTEEKYWVTYNDEQISQLVKKPDIKKCKFSEYRNWVMVCYFLGTGNRLSNVRNLRIKDISFESKEIFLYKTKAKRQYTIPLSDTLADVLKEYLKFRKGNPDDYVFVTQYNTQMTTSGVQTALNRYHIKRGVSLTNIHLYRHTFAKHWILNGGDSFRLKAILDHKTMTMVDRYVNMWGKDLQRDFDKFNPLDNVADQVVKKKILKLEREKKA